MDPSALPPPRPVVWELRPPDSAHLSTERFGGRVVVTIEHALLRGVTPEMLAWWYGHVPGTMTYAGHEYPRYLVWHPLDHISYEVVSPADADAVVPGTRLHLVEALQRDPRKVIDIRVEVAELGEAGAVIAQRRLNSDVVRLENEFHRAEGGVRYVTRLKLGDDTFAGRLVLNWIARNKAFPPPKLQGWIRHHIEEIGNLENFLPTLVREVAG